MPVPTAVPPIGMFSSSRFSARLARMTRVLGLGRVTGEHLADANRRGIHQMRAADLDDLVPLFGFARRGPCAAA